MGNGTFHPALPRPLPWSLHRLPPPPLPQSWGGNPLQERLVLDPHTKVLLAVPSYAATLGSPSDVVGQVVCLVRILVRMKECCGAV